MEKQLELVLGGSVMVKKNMKQTGMVRVKVKVK